MTGDRRSEPGPTGLLASGQAVSGGAGKAGDLAPGRSVGEGKEWSAGCVKLTGEAGGRGSIQSRPSLTRATVQL